MVNKYEKFEKLLQEALDAPNEGKIPEVVNALEDMPVGFRKGEMAAILGGYRFLKQEMKKRPYRFEKSR